MRFEVQSGWRGHEGHFVRRVGCFAVLMVISIFLLGGVTAGMVFRSETEAGEGPPVHALLLLIPFGLIMWAIVRSLGVTAKPIGAVMAAADRVAEGDYAVRVEPRGSPDVRHLIATFNSMTERLEEHDQQRRMLLADIAHELRNPLAIIRGKVEGVIDGVYPPTEPELQPLVDEIGHMTRLLDDLQTLSLAESGELALRREWFALSEFLADVANACRVRVEAALLTLTVVDGADIDLYADPIRLRQVIENVIGNATRHTPTGGAISVQSRRIGDQVVIEIHDNGRGITPDDLPYIFDRFTKAADSGGSGLGLAIARRLIEAHGGRIYAASEIGIGTMISIELPIGG